MFHRYFFYCLCVLLLTVPIEASNFNPFELEINLSKDFEVERVDSYPGQPGNPVPPGPPVGGGFPTYPPYNPSPSYPGYESASQLYQRGLNAYSQSDFRNAISYFTQFLDRFPYDLKAGEACFYCADSYKQLNDFYNAITLFRRVVNQYPSFKKVDEAAFFIGFCLVKVNDFYGALGEFRSFVVKFSLSHLVDNAWYVSGRTHEQIQDIQNAIFCYRKVVYEFPNSEVYRASRDRLNALEGNHPPTYPPTNPPYPPTYPPINVSDRELYDRGHSELVRGNYPKAISYFSELIERYPQSDLADDAALWKGKTHLDARNYNQAMKAFVDFKNRYHFSDLLPEACYSLAWSEYQLAMGDYSKREYFRKAGRDFAEFSSNYGLHVWAAEALFLAGESYERYGDVNLARSYFREVISRFPNTPSAQKSQDKLNGIY